MNIFAVVKKAINSNLDKPLDVTLGEIHQSVLQKNSPKRIVDSVVGVPYNATHNAQVLSLNDAPVFSVEGSGRILQVIPVSKASVTGVKQGTAFLTVDDEIIINNMIKYASTASNYNGCYIVDYVDTHLRSAIYSDIFGSSAIYYVSPTDTFFGDVSIFSTTCCSVVAPNGVPFKNGFEIRLTQSASETITDAGVIVVYELYE